MTNGQTSDVKKLMTPGSHRDDLFMLRQCTIVNSDTIAKQARTRPKSLFIPGKVHSELLEDYEEQSSTLNSECDNQAAEDKFEYVDEQEDS